MGDYVRRIEDFHILTILMALKKPYRIKVICCWWLPTRVGLAIGWYTEEELAKMHLSLKENLPRARR